MSSAQSTGSRPSTRSVAATPTIVDNVMFFLLFSGPPKFRIRDINDSLDSIVDWVVLLHVAVWSFAGLWIVTKLWFSKTKIELNFSMPEKLGLWLVASLSVSAFFSDGPALTGFKVYQLLVTILFASLFVRLFGMRACLDRIFACCAILCLADAVAAFVAPSMVMGESEFGAMRFRGDLIASTGVVSVLGLVLLLSNDRKRSPLQVWGGVALFGSVLILSLMRTSYVAFLAFLLVALWKAPEMKLLKRVTRWALVVLPLAAAGGALAQLEEYRAAESIWTLSDRVGLWAYLIDTMWTKSPWFGLGYFSASRVYGPQFNEDLGTAHSVFVEVFAGGGLVSFSIFLLLWCILILYAWRLMRGKMTPLTFAAVGLLVVTTSLVFVGSELEADAAGFTLWVLVASIPALARQHSRARAGSVLKPMFTPGEGPLPHPI